MMPVMAVNNENQHEPAGEDRSRPRWSVGKKMEAVLRLLRGEPLEVLSGHKLQVAHEMYASGQYTVAAIAKTLGVSRASIYCHLTRTGG
jgi:predicted transcriptional regulator YheO